MALITCDDCKTEISDAAEACPKCGRPVATKTPQGGAATRGSNTVFYAVIGFAVGFVLAWGGCGSFEKLHPEGVMLFAFGGAIFAVVGGIIGSNVGASRRR